LQDPLTDPTALSPSTFDPGAQPPPAQGELAPAGERQLSIWTSYLAAPSLAYPLLLATCASLFFVNLGGFPIYTKGEAREAVTVLDMIKGHSLATLLLPMRAGLEIPSKPLLMHWLIALCACVVGLNEWAVRLPSALLATMAVLCCYGYVRRLFDDLSGLFAALVLATSLQFLQQAVGGRVDMTLTFFMELAFFEFLAMAEGLTTRRLLLYGALALAVLAKGPVGLLLPALTAAGYIALEQRSDLLGRMRLPAGATMVAVIAGGWYLAAMVIGGRAFFDKQVLAENIFTFLYHRGVSGGHGHPFYYLDLALLAGFLPWTFLVPIMVTTLAAPDYYRNPRVRYLILWFVLVLLFYSFAYSKRGVYLLSLYPALAAAMGLALAQASRSKPSRWLPALTRATAWFSLGAAAVASLGVSLLLARPQAMAAILSWSGIKVAVFTSHLALGVRQDWGAAGALIAALFAVGYLLMRGRPDHVRVLRLVGGLTATMAALSMITALFVAPAIADTLSLKAFSLAATRIIGDQSAAYLYYLDYGVAFYSGRTMPLLESPTASHPSYLIAGAVVYEADKNSTLSDYHPVLASNPTDFDGSGVTLLLHRTSSDR